MSSTHDTRTAEILLTPADVADRLGVPARTVRDWTRCPSIADHVHRSGRRIYLRSAVIDELRHYTAPDGPTV